MVSELGALSDAALLQASTIATLESELAKVKKSGSSQSQEASAEIAALRKENERLQQANKELEEENSSFKSNLAELEQASRTEVSDLQEKVVPVPFFLLSHDSLTFILLDCFPGSTAC